MRSGEQELILREETQNIVLYMYNFLLCNPYYLITYTPLLSQQREYYCHNIVMCIPSKSCHQYMDRPG